MPTFLERASGQDNGSLELLELPFFETALQLYVADVATASVFERGELALTVSQLQELTDLLALMPQQPADRVAWQARVLAIFRGARLYLEPLDSQPKVAAALGL